MCFKEGKACHLISVNDCYGDGNFESADCLLWVVNRRWFLDFERLFSPKETLVGATWAAAFGQEQTLIVLI